MSWFTPCVVAAFAVSALVAAPACAATRAPSPAPRPLALGGIGLRLMDVPLATRQDPRVRLYIVDHLAPGTVIHRRIRVTNTTAKTVRIGMYSAAATIKKGAFLGAAGHTRNELSTWTSVRPKASRIPAHAGLTATVTIAVPRDAAPGEQYGVVWAEARSAPPSGGGITEVSRVGIRLYVSVGPGGAPAANFKIDSLSAKRSPDGRPMVLASVRNTGGRALDMYGSLRLLAGPGGLKAGPFPAKLGTTLGIGDTQPISIVLDKQLPAGPWDARVTLRSGLLKRGARARITFPASAKPSSSSLLIPVIAAIALLLLIAVGTAILRRRRRRAAPAPA